MKKKEQDVPTIIIDEHNPDQNKYERLKEKLRYKQALRENSRKIDHKQVRLNIQADALPSKTFFIMNALAAIIAGYGLLSDSTAVVIGAMLVAMMLGPISGIALALIDARWLLLRTALKTLVLGVIMIYAIGMIMGFIHFDLPMTNEILARTKPTAIDLMIALAGGAAGAFSAVSPRLSVAVVGVAVATALVPPLVASGILLAHGQFQNSANAFLLAFTNMVAIQVSSSLVLWIAGFRRGSDEDVNSLWGFFKRNSISLIILLILAIYLSLNLMQSVQKQLYETQIKQQISQNLNINNNVIDTIQFDQRENFTIVRTSIRGDTPPMSSEIEKINTQLAKDRKGHPSYLQVRFIPVQIIQTSPLQTVNLDKQDAQELSIQTAN
ncbi:TIGR00341 family protein [Acinetobacter sp. ANC 3832]|uniref:TIGR00341 family protein n=1 Tax=Acinetobacter sp. ANC 3832 TaxID=1977874 RepID=UPI000A357543|nr:TIGR00341 family protein [Acinetobacter sp. ANC 3832]OTG95439.1 TIGR00341 family protein [Acinetobacter sp. ANC 3832]